MEAVDRRTFLKSVPHYLLDGIRGFLTEVAAENSSDSADTERGGRRRVAILDVSRCLAWGGGECQLCYLQCPLRDEAIVLDAGKPAIVTSSCDGCGVCVDACRSVNDLAAVQLVEVGAVRNMT